MLRSITAEDLGQFVDALLKPTALIELAVLAGCLGLAWGVVSGAVLHLAVQLPAFFSLRSQFRFSLPVSNPAVRNVVRLMAPRIIGQSAVQFNFLVNTILSSSLSVGSLSAIGWAFQLMLMPEIAIARVTLAGLSTNNQPMANSE